MATAARAAGYTPVPTHAFVDLDRGAGPNHPPSLIPEWPPCGEGRPFLRETFRIFARGASNSVDCPSGDDDDDHGSARHTATDTERRGPWPHPQQQLIEAVIEIFRQTP